MTIHIYVYVYNDKNILKLVHLPASVGFVLQSFCPGIYFKDFERDRRNINKQKTNTQ